MSIPGQSSRVQPEEIDDQTSFVTTLLEFKEGLCAF